MIAITPRQRKRARRKKAMGKALFVPMAAYTAARRSPSLTIASTVLSAGSWYLTRTKRGQRIVGRVRGVFPTEKLQEQTHKVSERLLHRVHPSEDGQDTPAPRNQDQTVSA
jgi:hypothetical protein